MKDNKFVPSNVNKTLTLTIETLESLKSYVDTGFTEIVDLIHHSKGRVIFSGIGKSAIIAQKASATFNSTGTKAGYMHSTDALHGDLGSINTDDVLFLISKSGASKEIIDLIKIATKINIKIIALVNIANEKLKALVDHYLLLPVAKEACKNNLAPTTSCAVQMIFIDAIAIALQENNNFNSDDFAKLHPGGSLGKRLNVKVTDLINANFPKVKSDDKLKTIIYEISSKRIGATAVFNNENKVAGIITDGDLRRMLENDIDFNNITAKEIMTINPTSINSNDLAYNALNLMRTFKISQVLVESENKTIGFIHIQDILNEGIS